jgi:NTP pyrophosphatase (non-canonical NTP hydrolase)
MRLRDINQLQYWIYEWANKHMPDRTPADAIKKLTMEEVPELWRTYKETGKLDESELADILIIILDLCEMGGTDAVKIICDKMEVNILRKWKIEHGVLQHIPEEKWDGATAGHGSDDRRSKSF